MGQFSAEKPVAPGSVLSGNQQPRRERRAEAERALDEAIEGSFPASDPLASTRTIAGGPDHPSKASRSIRSERRG
jgi:hypothetical protein